MLDSIINYIQYYYPKISKHLPYSKDIIKSALIFRYLYESYLQDTIPLETAIYYLNTLPIKSESRVIRNHLIFHRAFKTFRKKYKVGRGCVYLFDCPIKSEVLGFLTGIIYWVFNDITV